MSGRYSRSTQQAVARQEVTDEAPIEQAAGDHFSEATKRPSLQAVRDRFELLRENPSLKAVLEISRDLKNDLVFRKAASKTFSSSQSALIEVQANLTRQWYESSKQGEDFPPPSKWQQPFKDLDRIFRTQSSRRAHELLLELGFQEIKDHQLRNTVHRLWDVNAFRVLLRELMIISQTRLYTLAAYNVGTETASTSASGAWSFLPRSHAPSLQSHDVDYVRRFQMAFQISTRSEALPISGLALLTYSLLMQLPSTVLETEGELAASIPFTRFIAALLVGSSISVEPSRTENYFDPKTTALLDGVIPAVIHSIEQATRIATQSPQALTKTASPKLSNSDSQDATKFSWVAQWPGVQDPTEEFFGKQIARCLEQGNLVRAENVWQEACRTWGERGSMEKVVMPSKLYRHFLTLFMELRHSQRALEVWNTMVKSHVQPDVQSWSAMLQGCANAKDPHTLETLWERMRASGVVPDTQAWTIRIEGLMSRGKWTKGYQAFIQMVREWETSERTGHIQQGGESVAASRKDIVIAAKPNVRTINVVIKGLAQYKSNGRSEQDKQEREDNIGAVLRWGRANGIEPDSFTFNPLIKQAIQNGKPERALDLLSQMEAMKIQPDVATYTLILDAIFKYNYRNVPVTEQREAVIMVLEEMEKRGLEPSAHTFATIIDRLLKVYGNLDAALGVLADMVRKDKDVPALVYTSLATYYFSQPKPDLNAVEALWTLVKGQASRRRDQFFYDRMVSGYAKADEVSRMMYFLFQMGKEEKVTGWTSLVDVVQALARAGDWHRVRSVVMDVEREKEWVRARRNDKGKNEWFALVGDLERQGLLSEDDVMKESVTDEDK